MKLTKTIPFFIFFLLFLQCSPEKSVKNKLSAPDGWRSEILQLPLDFAPSLAYTGVEYVQFAPGWGTKGAKDYFSYVFLWEIDQDPALSAKKIEKELEIYYDGLMNIVAKSDVNENQIPKSKAFFEKISTTTFVGKVLTYDAFITKQPVELFIIVNHTPCQKENKHLVRFDISPQPTNHPVWKKLNNVGVNIKCE